MSGIAESHVEEAALAWLEELGYYIANGLVIGPDGSAPERANYGDVVLANRVKAAIARLNPHLKADIREDVFRKILQSETPSLTEENRRLHRYLIEGVPPEPVRRRELHNPQPQPYDKGLAFATGHPLHSDRHLDAG